MFDFSRGIKFLSYTLFSGHKRGAGIHSPFVYDLIVDVLNGPVDKSEFLEIEKLRKDLGRRKEKVYYKDPGAGSRIKRKDPKSIARIVKTSSTKSKYGELLYKLVRKFKPENILELGTSLGLGSMYLAKGNSNSQVYTIEGVEPLYKLARQNFEMIGFKNIHIYHDLFSDGLPKLLEKVVKFDMVYFDGHHSYDHTWQYFKSCIPKVTNETIFIFDDIHWSAGMERLWSRVIRDERVAVSIDLFQLGLVFFRKELSKQHFVVKY